MARHHLSRKGACAKTDPCACSTPRCPTGATGATGAEGPTGPAGEATGSGAIIPFASGLPAELTHVVGGEADERALIGFGTHALSSGVGSGEVDLAGGVATLLNMAFIAPRPGVLSQLTVYFTTVEPTLDDQDAELTFQLYRSQGPASSLYDPIPGSQIVLPVPADIAAGTLMSGTVALAEPVVNGDRLLLVASLDSSTPLDLEASLSGYISGGLSID